VAAYSHADISLYQASSAPSATPTLHEAPIMERKGEQSLSKPVESFNNKKRPYRPYVESFDKILHHHHQGSGTEEDPYIVDWMPKDAEDPQTWSGVYKWFTSEFDANSHESTRICPARTQSLMPSRRCCACHHGRRTSVVRLFRRNHQSSS